MFSGGELWATNGPARDRSGVCKTTIQRSKGCITIDLTLIMLRCSASNPTIDKLPVARSVYFPMIRCLWPGFCFGQYLMFSCTLGITHHALVHCKLSISQPRPVCNDSDALQQRLSWRTYLKPRSGVNHVKSRRCSSHSPPKTRTIPNPTNSNNMNPQSNPKCNA